MTKFQSLILIVIILISVLIFKASNQDIIKVAQTENFEANISVVVSNPWIGQKISSEFGQSVNLEQSQEIISEPVQEEINELVLQSEEQSEEQPEEQIEQQSEGDYSQSENIVVNSPQPIIHSHIASVKYLDNNLDFFELNISNRWPIASLTKLMTAVIVAENGNLDNKIIINKDGFKFETNGSAGGLSSGESFTVEDLIKVMLITSSNDAAVALAEAINPEFVGLMNQKATKLKMTETNFYDPTGLSYRNQSTVNDLAKLINYIYYIHPKIFEITRQKEVEILELNSRTTRKLTNINKLAGGTYFIGGKTGYIDAADENLISLFAKHGRLILITVLGSKSRFADTETLLELVAKP